MDKLQLLSSKINQHTYLGKKEFLSLLGYEKNTDIQTLESLVNKLNTQPLPVRVFVKRFDLIVHFNNNEGVKDGVYINRLCTQTNSIILTEKYHSRKYQFKVSDEIVNIDQYLKDLFYNIQFQKATKKDLQKFYNKDIYKTNKKTESGYFWGNNIVDNSNYLNGYKGIHEFREIDTGRFISYPLFDDLDDESFS